MADNNLPPLHEEPTEETVVNDYGITRPAQPIADDTEQNKKHRTEVLRKAEPTRQNRPAPTGSHVQPIEGQGNRPRQSPQQGYAPRPRRRRNDPKDNALYLPWWSIVLMLLGVIVVSFGVVGGVILLGGSMNNILAEPSPIIMIVTADTGAINPASTQTGNQPPSTEIISGQNAPSELELQGPTLAPVQLSPTPAAIQIGSVVIVEGVDANTLNVRSSASLTESSILFRAEEGEIFNIVDGPAQSDGFTWWQIQDPSDVNRTGWAVSNFLTVQAQ